MENQENYGSLVVLTFFIDQQVNIGIQKHQQNKQNHVV